MPCEKYGLRDSDFVAGSKEITVFCGEFAIVGVVMGGLPDTTNE